jgi:hypothetical protein
MSSEKKYRKSLTEMISNEAEQTFKLKESEPISYDNFEKYCKHWIETAENIHDRMKSENLSLTCEKLREIINFHKKYTLPHNGETY